jgi:hypothetical protein
MGINYEEIYERFEMIETVRNEETTQLETFTKSVTDQYRSVFEEIKKTDTK